MNDPARSRRDLTSAELDSSLPVLSGKSAVALIDEGNALEQQGRFVEAMARYDAAVQADPQCARAHLNRGNILLAGGRIAEARHAYQRAIACDPNYAGAHFNLGNLNCRAGAYDAALHNYQAAIGIKPDWADAFVATGNALHSLGRTAEATDAYQQALALNPDYAEVHSNLGLIRATAGQYQQAADSLRKAIELQPEYAAAHFLLGKVSTDMGQLDAAESSFRRALALMPEDEKVVADLATVLQLRGKGMDGVELTLRYLERMPTPTMKTAFVNCVIRTRFTTSSPLLRTALTATINDAWAAPQHICGSALNVIMLDPVIAGCVRRANERWPTRLTSTQLFGPTGLSALATDSLLHALLEAVPVSTIEFERFLTAARYALLETVVADASANSSSSAALRFYCALASQCFINEYIFDFDERERAQADACRTRLLALLDANALVPPLLLLTVAAYYPLYTLPDPGRLLTTEQPDLIGDVLRQQVREPLEEQTLRAGLKQLTSIGSGVSEEVRAQYEQNPYPRWVKTCLLKSPLSFNEWLRRMLPRATFTPMPDDTQPEMLIAGCGTGSQPISAVQAIRGVRVVAVDLSLSSIGYALRKTRELGITSIEYGHADILKLGDMERRFDIVASGGVLHHLAEPFTGWRILLSRLRPGGFMFIGLYSRLARQHVTKARDLIAARGYTSTLDDIRRFRRDLSAGRLGAELQQLTQSPDFYSTSNCRDLIFHVQEHCLTLDQIEAFLAECGLQFLGFDLDHTLLHRYHRRFVDDPTGTNLRNWAQFEAENPKTFIGMYRFWVQRPSA